MILLHHSIFNFDRVLRKSRVFQGGNATAHTSNILKIFLKADDVDGLKLLVKSPSINKSESFPGTRL